MHSITGVLGAIFVEAVKILTPFPIGFEEIKIVNKQLTHKIKKGEIVSNITKVFLNITDLLTTHYIVSDLQGHWHVDHCQHHSAWN